MRISIIFYLSLVGMIHAFRPLYSPLNSRQEKLNNYLNDKSYPIVIAEGSAGTGKTLLSTQYAIEQLHNSYIKKIVITRPTILTGADIGYLPGTLDQKMQPWMMPILDVLIEFYTKDKLKKLFQDGSLEIVPLGFMRGRSFKNTIVIADEMQNSTPDQMKMLITRIGTDSKIIITGDIKQTDISTINGLYDLLERLRLYYQDEIYKQLRDGIAIVHFNHECIERHPIISKILSIYED